MAITSTDHVDAGLPAFDGEEAPMTEETDEVVAAGRALRDLMNAAELLRRAVARSAHIGGSDLVAVGELARHGAMTPRSLATQLHTSTAMITALVDRLERSGHVRRTPNPRDRRSALVELNPDARERVEAVQRRMDVLVEGLPDLPRLAESLHEIAQRVRDASAEFGVYLQGVRDPLPPITKSRNGPTATDIVANTLDMNKATKNHPG